MKVSYSKYQNILFALFLMSGAIKFIFDFYQFPLDITMLLSVLIVGDILWNQISNTNKIALKPFQVYLLLIVLSLLILIVFSLTYTKSESYSILKTIAFGLNVLSFVYPIFMVKFREKVFFRTFLYVIIPASIIFLTAKTIYWFGDVQAMKNKYMLFGGSYLLLGDILVFGLYYLIKSKKWLLAFLFTILLLAIGAKGPFVFFVVVLLFWKHKNIFNIKLKAKILNKTKWLLIILVPLAVIFRDQVLKTLQFGVFRFSRFFDAFTTESSDSRIGYFSFAIENIFNSVSAILFGHGIGSFGIMYNGIDARDFPHNIFLETWFELGVVGVILITILLVLPILLKNRQILFKLAALYVLLNYLKSGNLDGARVLFGVYGLLIFINKETYHES